MEATPMSVAESPQVWSSDGHDYDQLGQRFTWVKMTCPSLEGLRLALLDGSESLKPAKQGDSDDPNAHADLAIESITVRDGKFMGRSSPMTVAFNPWLNTIIGGRGTGKSTLIDFCRKTLRRESELDGRASDDEGSLARSVQSPDACFGGSWDRRPAYSADAYRSRVSQKPRSIHLVVGPGGRRTPDCPTRRR